MTLKSVGLVLGDSNGEGWGVALFAVSLSMSAHKQIVRSTEPDHTMFTSRPSCFSLNTVIPSTASLCSKHNSLNISQLLALQIMTDLSSEHDHTLLPTASNKFTGSLCPDMVRTWSHRTCCKQLLLVPSSVRVEYLSYPGIPNNDVRVTGCGPHLITNC